MKSASARLKGRLAYDMDILNIVFDYGKEVKLLSYHYATLESYFYYPKGTDVFASTYYVHFSRRKPHLAANTRRYNNANNPYFLIFMKYWEAHDKACQGL